MKPRTARSLDVLCLSVMMIAATIAMLFQFTSDYKQFTGLTMLVGFWPAFAAHLFLERLIWRK